MLFNFDKWADMHFGFNNIGESMEYLHFPTGSEDGSFCILD